MMFRTPVSLSCVASRACRVGWTSLAIASVWASPLPASTVPPTVAQALSLKPIQANVDYDIPDDAARESCQVLSAKELDQRGWIVRDGSGRLLRRFIDTNADNRLDQWCYYQNGVEVYRDIDSDFDEKADEYRWMGTAGTRWGLDPNEDGTIDRWKVISAEEASAEIVAAVRERDWKRFERVLLSPEELESLGVSGEKQRELEAQLAKAREAFEAFVADQEIVTPTSQWSYFGGTRPSLIPEGTDGSTQDIVFYDNVIAVVEDGGDHRQLALGTLIQVDQGWRVVNSPEPLVSGQAMQPRSLFIQASLAREVGTPGDESPEGVSGKMQELLLKLGEAETRVNEANAAGRPQALAAYIAVLKDLAAEAETPSDKVNWIRQAADTLYIDFQRAPTNAGLQRMVDLAEQLEAAKAPVDALAYLDYRLIEAQYMAQSAAADADPAEQQEQWVKALEDFVNKYSASEVAGDALRELALVEEFAQNNDKALERYQQIVEKYPQSTNADKARGAVWRLTAEGKPVQLQGTTVEGETFNLSSYRGKPVIIHCWATWCDVCTQEFDTLKSLKAKYAKQGLQCVGINVDLERQDVVTYLSKNRLPWPQLFAEGGQDSDLANQFGLVSLPVTLLVDEEGKVVKQVFSMPELSTELEKLLK